MPDALIQRILRAHVYEVAVETPIHPLRGLSRTLGQTILVKREDLQPVFSFKIRGAYNKLRLLSAAERARGVFAASAGNHAQGVALAAATLGVNATIVMPVTTPAIKVEAVRARGARVVLHGDFFDEACARALELTKDARGVFLHPYDDLDVIAGQGTIGVEIGRQCGPLDAVFVPVGGGGLIAGVAAYLKYLRPEVRIVGVEPDDAACLKAALAARRRVTLPRVGLFAEGVAVARVGAEPFRIARQCVDEVVTATTDEICAAIKDLFDDTRSIAEPAGALALAGLKNWVRREGVRGRSLLAIHSGANVDFQRLRYIAERTDLGQHREALLAVTLPERPGALRAFCRRLSSHDITGFNYRYDDAREARLLVSIQLAGNEKPAAILRTLRAAGIRAEDLSGNELAKNHSAHLVGGPPPPGTPPEAAFRIEFPERPGALSRFLDGLGRQWNISRFHYRKQGGTYGEVLIGLQAPPAERAAVLRRLRAIGYPFTPENTNPAYRHFLA